MPSGRLPNPNGSEQKSKTKISLSNDLPIIKDLVIVLKQTGWKIQMDPLSLIFLKDEARLFYSRRTNVLQLYWQGYGHQQIEAPLFQFNEVEDIIIWIDLLNQVELETPAPEIEEEEEVDEWADLDPSEIIDRIFE